LFERPHHRRIATVLAALDAPMLAANGCYFGGGTAIALSHGEYRESADIDFLVSDLTGFRALRQRVTGQGGLAALARPGATLAQLREVRADQYGIRTVLGVDGDAIKFEIVLEARIVLATPTPTDLVCGVATLTALDMATSKLLANSDRWADDSVFSRDVIDLAVLQPKRKLLAEAVAKASLAYGDSITNDMDRAVRQLRDRDGRLAVCMQALQINLPKALLWQRIRALAAAGGQVGA
jgi:hypothetical protein